MSSPERKKRSPTEDAVVDSAAVVTPQKSSTKKQRLEEAVKETEDETKEQESENVITAESIMGFPKYPNVTNRDIMINHYGFVSWVKKKKAEEGKLTGGLAAFLDWVDSDEGQRLEIEGQGQERFNFGQHRGETFADIAQADPGYHGRYVHMLNKNGESPNPVLSRYIAWFEKAGHGGNEKFTEGRHRGQTFRQVAREDPSYHLRCEAKGYNPGGMQSYKRYFAQHGDRYAAERGERDAIESAMSDTRILSYVPDDDDDDYY